MMLEGKIGRMEVHNVKWNNPDTEWQMFLDYSNIWNKTTKRRGIKSDWRARKEISSGAEMK